MTGPDRAWELIRIWKGILHKAQRAELVIERIIVNDEDHALWSAEILRVGQAPRDTFAGVPIASSAKVAHRTCWLCVK